MITIDTTIKYGLHLKDNVYDIYVVNPTKRLPSHRLIHRCHIYFTNINSFILTLIKVHAKRGGREGERGVFGTSPRFSARARLSLIHI